MMVFMQPNKHQLPVAPTEGVAAPLIAILETSGRQGAVGLARGSRLIAEIPLQGAMRHAAEMFPALAALCRQQGVAAADIKQIFVSAGPGSFTGLRVAFAGARAMAQAIGCQLIAVPTLDVLAENAPPSARYVAVLLDAKRGQVYAAGYETILEPGPDPVPVRRRIFGPELTDPSTLLRALPRPLALLGEGIDYHRGALAAAGDANVAELDRALWPPRAAAVHRLGWQMACRAEFIELNRFLPVYVRRPEAEEVWMLKQEAANTKTATRES